VTKAWRLFNNVKVEEDDEIDNQEPFHVSTGVSLGDEFGHALTLAMRRTVPRNRIS
jgi:hypothetical protein